MIVHREGTRKEAEGCVIVESPESSCKQTVHEVTESAMEHVGGRRFYQGRAKKSGEELYYRVVFDEEKAVNCSVLEELELTTKAVVG